MRASAISSVLALGLAVAAPAAGEDVVRTVQAELSGQDVSRFAVENLAGTMRISAGTGETVTLVATVHAETKALADAVSIQKVSGEGGAATLRLRYPYDEVSTFRYEPPGTDTDGFFPGFVSASTYDYDGRRVRVSPGHGKWLWADLEVRVPAGRLAASFRNLVGQLEAGGLTGQLRFEVASADLRLRQLDGEIALEGSSGDTRARDVKGSWTSRFSSGDLSLEDFSGDALSMSTTSGDLVVRHLKARRVEIETTSGDARLADADLVELSAKATSGDVGLEASGGRLKDVQIRTSSGDVALELPADSAFDLEASQSSGDLDIRFSDGSYASERSKSVAYHRGSGGARIRVRTSSGDLTVTPG